MATTLPSDFKIYEDQFWSGYNETQAQQLIAFGAASNNALVLRSENIKGNFSQQSYMAHLADLVTRRDITSTSAATPLKLTMDEKVSVKLHRKVGPVDTTFTAFSMADLSMDEFSFILGQKAAQDVLADYLNSGLLALSAALSGVSGLVHDVSPGSISHSALNKAMSKMGDRAGAIRALVMHSVTYFDLVGQAIADKLFEVAGAVVYGGSPGTFGRPVVVTDSASLVESADYVILGLQESALEVVESQGRVLKIDDITGGENLVRRVQAEHAYNVGVKGFKWDMGNGGANPNASTLGTSSNWDKIATSVKDCAGFRLVVGAAA